jgi:hypothetical protein
MGILRCFNSHCVFYFVSDVILSDYLYKRQNPRYLDRFWVRYGNAEFWFNFAYDHSLPEFSIKNERCITHFKNNANTSENTSRRKNNLLNRTWGKKRISNLNLHKADYYAGRISQTSNSYTITTGNARPWCLRLKASYYDKLYVRWTHTVPVNATLHGATLLMGKPNAYAILAGINAPGQNYRVLLKASERVSSWMPNSDLYPKHSNISLSNNKHFIDVVENNLVMSFMPLANRNVKIGTYHPMKGAFGYDNLEANQMRPDVLLKFSESEYIYKGYLGIDQKANKSTIFGRNQIITPTNQSYNDIIYAYKEALINRKFNITDAMTESLDHLQYTKEDFERHLLKYASVLHLFPHNWRPPLYMKPSFRETHFKPEAQELMRIHHKRNQEISDKLRQYKIPEVSSSNLSNEALEPFYGSNIQQLFKDY